MSYPNDSERINNKGFSNSNKTIQEIQDPQDRLKNQIDGYRDGKKDAIKQEVNEREQTKSVLIGATIATLLGGLGLLYYFWNLNQPTNQVIVTEAPSTMPSPQPNGSVNVTVASPEVTYEPNVPLQNSSAPNTQSAQSAAISKPQTPVAPAASASSNPQPTVPSQPNAVTSPIPSKTNSSPQTETNASQSLPDDDQIQATLSNKIKDFLPSNNLDISVKDGVVTIKGKLKSPEAIEQTSKIVQALKGVKSFNNEITLE